MIEDRSHAAREFLERVIDGENGVLRSKGAASPPLPPKIPAIPEL